MTRLRFNMTNLSSSQYTRALLLRDLEGWMTIYFLGFQSIYWANCPPDKSHLKATIGAHHYSWWHSGQAAPQMPLWDIDDFELKLLKKQPIQEYTDPPLSPWKQEMNLPCQRYSSCTRRKRKTSYLSPQRERIYRVEEAG